MEIQSHSDGGKTIVIDKGEGRTQRIEVSKTGEIITSNIDGAATTLVPPLPPVTTRRKQLPEGLVDMMAIIFGSVTIMSLGAPLVKAWARRFEKRSEMKQQALVEQRLAAIEQAIETVAVEVERISEGQRFTTKLLADRAPSEMERVR
ncbi:hypothetical protein MASR1M101_15380 [Gemmatimonas sp.]